MGYTISKNNIDDFVENSEIIEISINRFDDNNYIINYNDDINNKSLTFLTKTINKFI